MGGKDCYAIRRTLKSYLSLKAQIRKRQRSFRSINFNLHTVKKGGHYENKKSFEEKREEKS